MSLEVAPGQEWVREVDGQAVQRIVIRAVTPITGPTIADDCVVHTLDIQGKVIPCAFRTFGRIYKLANDLKPAHDCFTKGADCLDLGSGLRNGVVRMATELHGLQWFCGKCCLNYPESMVHMSSSVRHELLAAVGCPVCGRLTTHEYLGESRGVTHCWRCDHEFFITGLVTEGQPEGPTDRRVNTLRRKAGGIRDTFIRGFHVRVGRNPVTDHPFKKGSWWEHRKTGHLFKIAEVYANSVGLEERIPDNTLKSVLKDALLTEYDKFVRKSVYDRLLEGCV